MKERSIIFSAPMVWALLDGRKTQTRRIVKLPPDATHIRPAIGAEASNGTWVAHWHEPSGNEDGGAILRCPYGAPGGRLWVKETWGFFGGDEYLYQREIGSVVYRADAIAIDRAPGGRWRPSIFMPRWASRILLEITDVRVERLQDISESDAIAEGVAALGSDGPNHWTVHADNVWLSSPTARGAYSMLWDWINGSGAWDANPFVWRVAFRRINP